MARKGDTYRFYDINPQVIAIAQREFTYLADSAATIELPLGDARLSLEREPKQNFDVLAVDAFSSDAIPVHLITSEALAIYKRHMKPGGVIAFHVTNRYLDLVPVVKALADAQGLAAILMRDDTKDGMTSTQRLGAPVRRSGIAREAGARRLCDADRAAAGLAAVDRRLQQPVAGAEVSVDAAVELRTTPAPTPIARWCIRRGARYVEALDQRALPHAVISVKIASADAAAMAIRTMWVRGAPLIGAVGAYGLALALDRDAGDDAPRQGARGARCDAPHRRQPALGARSRAHRRACARSRGRAPTPRGARRTRSPPRTRRSTTRSASTASRCCATSRRGGPARCA